MIIGTAGHVDHGKSSLVRALTGTDPDRLKEEKERGITIDLGFAYWKQPDGRVIGFVDVPGHERFVHTMLAGAHGIDLVLLVVAADDGVMPQTREHLAIMRLLGLTRAVVALTKIDLVDAARREAVMAEIAALLAPTPFAGADIIPVSVITGEGMDALADRLRAAPAAGPRRRPALPPRGRSLLLARRRRHGGDGHGAVRRRGARRSRAGLAVRAGGAGALVTSAEPGRRHGDRRRPLRAEPGRPGDHPHGDPPRRHGAGPRLARADPADRRAHRGSAGGKAPADKLAADPPAPRRRRGVRPAGAAGRRPHRAGRRGPGAACARGPHRRAGRGPRRAPRHQRQPHAGRRGAARFARPGAAAARAGADCHAARA